MSFTEAVTDTRLLTGMHVDSEASMLERQDIKYISDRIS